MKTRKNSVFDTSRSFCAVNYLYLISPIEEDEIETLLSLPNLVRSPWDTTELFKLSLTATILIVYGVFPVKFCIL